MREVETAGEGSYDWRKGKKGEGGESRVGWKSVEGRFPGLCRVTDFSFVSCYSFSLFFSSYVWIEGGLVRNL